MSSQEHRIVEPCKGWNTACAFCDKRFSKWLESEDEVLFSDDLAKPGLFMFAFQTKQGKEVVVIGYHQNDVKTEIQKHFNTLKRQISQKKHKESKSDIIVRYNIVENVESKDSCAIFSHWFNHGMMPRLTTKWPGEGILKSTQHYQFDASCNKWCHPSKEIYWKKQKNIVGPRAIKPCKGWKDRCMFCDSRFTSWVPYQSVIDTIPSVPGLAMTSIVNKGFREVVDVLSCTNLKQNLSLSKNYVIWYFTQEGRRQVNESEIEVRWLLVEDLSSENACFLYAHWINCRVDPICFSRDGLNPRNVAGKLGEDMLTNSEKFTFRSRDKQWCYEEEALPAEASFSKSKQKRNVLQSIKDDLIMNA